MRLHRLAGQEKQDEAVAREESASTRLFGGEEEGNNDYLPKVSLQEVWCEGCGEPRHVNSVFAKYLNGRIGSCSKCRGLKLPEK